jgi:DNA-binding transcriptional LysR family regulator
LHRIDASEELMEFAQLRYLRAVVRAGSVTAAAGAEHVSQPSVSKQIRALERELGVALFHRVGRRVVPTEAARELADCAGRVFDDVASTTTAIAGMASGAAGTVRLCATETVADHLLPSALSRLVAELPRARVRVEMLGTDDSVARVLADEVDFAIVALPLADSRLDIELLFEEEVLCALPPGHRWAGRRTVPLGEALCDPALLLSMPGHGLRTEVDSQARRLGIEVQSRIELRSQQALLAMVAAGGGIALAPRIAAEGRDDVVVRPFSPRLHRRVGWVRRRGRHVPPLGLRLLELINQRRG